MELPYSLKNVSPKYLVGKTIVFKDEGETKLALFILGVHMRWQDEIVLGVHMMKLPSDGGDSRLVEVTWSAERGWVVWQAWIRNGNITDCFEYEEYSDSAVSFI